MRTYLLKHRLLSMLLLIFTLSFSIPCFANSIQISLDGKVLDTSVAPISKNGTTLVPLRLISENLGADVNYDKFSKKISITSNISFIELYINSQEAKINNQPMTLSMSPEIVSNTTMVPIRFISEALNCIVDWDKTNQIVKITSPTITESSNLPLASIKVKDYGTITLELYPNLAPNTVNNFISLANSGYYNGLTFHRVISNFMIQGGDPQGNGTGGPGYTIAGEFASNGFTSNTLSHTKGIISMARTYIPDSAGSQFFITSADGTYLDGQYAAFGKVLSGLEIVDSIQNVNTDFSDKPMVPVVIESISVNTHGKTYPEPIKYSE